MRAVFAVAHVHAQRREAQARMTAAIIFNILRLLEAWYLAWQRTRTTTSHPANDNDEPQANPHWDSVWLVPLSTAPHPVTPSARRQAVVPSPARAPPWTGLDWPRAASPPPPLPATHPNCPPHPRKTPPTGDVFARPICSDYETIGCAAETPCSPPAPHPCSADTA